MANNGFNVNSVIKHLFGNINSLKSIENVIGSNYGSKKVIPFDNFKFSLGTANPNWSESRTTGLAKVPGKPEIIPLISIYSWTEPTFTKTGVSSCC